MARNRQAPRSAKAYRDRLWEQIHRYERHFDALAATETPSGAEKVPQLATPADMREYRGLIKVDIGLFKEYLAMERVRRLELLFEKEAERDLRARTTGAGTPAEAGESDRCH